MGYFFYVFLAVIGCLNANPFEISFPCKKDVTNEDYIEIQEQLRKINIDSLLKDYYGNGQGLAAWGDFYGRSTMGIRWTLIDAEKGLFPSTYLEKIGNGGNRCVVTFGTLNGNYGHFVRSLSKGLLATGFNGYLYYRLGGFPNPTGCEIRYAGVPYCFKVFLLQEAHQLGFDQVLWVDSVMIPLRDPTPLFNRIAQHGGVFFGHIREHGSSYIFPEFAQKLWTLTGTDVLSYPNMMAGFFGLDMSQPEAKLFVERYNQLVGHGYSFISCYPEEFVISAILGQPEFRQWMPHWEEEDYRLLCCHHPNPDSLDTIELSKYWGYMFHHRCMKNLIEGWDE